MEKVKNLILGAGIAGLACADRINKAGDEATVFEAENYAGGLCHSFMINDFRFDSATHLAFAEENMAQKFFEETRYQCHLPISYNFYHSLWIKQPVLNNLYTLSIDEKVQCIQSFVERERTVEINDYGQWLRANYGEVVSEKFYNIYTRKYWRAEPSELSVSWLKKRLTDPNLEKILRGAFSAETGIDHFFKEFYYPVGNGGYEAFLKPLLRNANVVLNKRCVSVDLREKYVRFQDGSVYYYDNLFSSIPLPLLINCIVGIPDDMKNLATGLQASKVSLVSIGFNKPDIIKWLWFYIYDEDIMAARVNSPSVKSGDNAPKGCSSLQFEIYHGLQDVINREEILDNTKYALQKMNLCKEEDILFMDYRLLPYGNVIFYKGMEQKRDILKEYLKEQQVKLIGRFGEWDYLWSYQSYLSGYRAVE